MHIITEKNVFKKQCLALKQLSFSADIKAYFF